MRKIIFTFLAGLTAVTFVSCGGDGGKHLIRHKADREQVAENIRARQGWLPEFPLGITQEEKEGLEFLYAYMPIGDVADYTHELYLKNVQASLEAMKEMPWGSTVPNDLFLHYVLPVRVNNENLDISRGDFFTELKDRVKGLSMKEAVLEVNHWCHEKVIYTPSDGRTMAPGALVRNAEGRCGEESTFTVAALRSVGIPARQVYTPRWAHTDDNHAWIEAWADGVWYYMGACEPEPVLNMGWFDAPSKRGMLMHTKIFGKYRAGDEDIIVDNPLFTEINVTHNYAEVATATVTVKDLDGKPVEGARVDFSIYNYAEFYPAAKRTTDKHGRTSFRAGQGDMLVWATDGEHFGYEKLSFGKQDGIEIVLRHKGTRNERHTVDFDIVPPAEAQTEDRVTPEQRAENNRRLAVEDSIRNAYIATWISESDARAFAKLHNLDGDKIWKFLQTSRGNYQAILNTLAHGIENGMIDVTLDLLDVLPKKDLQDTPAGVLTDHVSLAAPYKDRPYFKPYILNPRVNRELLVPYRSALSEVVQELDIEGIIAKAKAVQLADSLNPARIPISPLGVLNLDMGDEAARDRYFIAMARTKGIPARYEPVTGRMQYYDSEGKKWIYVEFDTQTETAQNVQKGLLMVHYTPTKLNPDPKYYSHFTIGKLKDGRYSTISLSNPDTDMGSAGSLLAIFRKPVELEEGDYMLTSGTRMANGTVLTQVQFFSIVANEQTTLTMEMREDKGAVQVIGNMNSEEKFTAIGENGKPNEEPQSILATTGRGYYVVGLLGVNQEPTNHALRDIAALKDEFEKWGRKIILLFGSEEQWEKFKPEMQRFGILPNTVVYGVDTNGEMAGMLQQSLELQNMNNLPVFVIGDTFNRVVFQSQGYTIGLGEQMMKVINSL